MKRRRELFFIFALSFVAKVSLFGAEGFELSGINVGYMSKDELCPAHISVEEMSAFIGRLNVVLVEFYRGRKDAHQFDLVVVVHREHIHFWFVGGRNEADLGEFARLRERLQQVSAPKLTREPIGFSLHAAIATDRSPKPGISLRPPPIPLEWKGAAAKDHSDLQLHFDGLVDLLCPLGAPLSADASVHQPPPVDAPSATHDAK